MLRLFYGIKQPFYALFIFGVNACFCVVYSLVINLGIFVLYLIIPITLLYIHSMFTLQITDGYSLSILNNICVQIYQETNVSSVNGDFNSNSLKILSDIHIHFLL